MEQETFDVDSLNFPEETTDTVAEATPTGNETEVQEPIKTTEVAETPTETTPQDKVEETTPTEPVKEEVKISDPPSRFEGESEIQFNLRKQIYDAGQAKAQAQTPEEKSELAKHIKGLRKELAVETNKTKASEAVQTPAIETSESQTQKSEEELAKEALRKMGYLSKEEVEQTVQEMLANRSRQDEHLLAAKEFYSTHKDIASNPAQREVLEKFVVERFNITPQSSKHDLLVAMDMARAYLFPKTDNRSARAAESADKRDLVSLSSNTQTVPTTSKEDTTAAKALEEIGSSMKEMGWE